MNFERNLRGVCEEHNLFFFLFECEREGYINAALTLLL